MRKPIKQNKESFSSDRLPSGKQLLPGNAISTRAGNAELIMQTDGNLVMYRTRDNFPVWASNTHGRCVRECIMQTDGILVIYDAYGQAIWSTNTYGMHGSELRIQDDGHMGIYQNGNCIWASGTKGRC